MLIAKLQLLLEFQTAYNRLKLDEAKLRSAIAGVRDVGNLSDPAG